MRKRISAADINESGLPVGNGLLGLEAELGGRHGLVELRNLPRAVIRVPVAVGALGPIFAVTVAIPDGIRLDQAIAAAVALVLAGQVPHSLDGRSVREPHINVELVLCGAGPHRVVKRVAILIECELDRPLLAALVLLTGSLWRDLRHIVIANVVIRRQIGRTARSPEVDDELARRGVILRLEQNLNLAIMRRKHGHRGVVLAGSGHLGHDGARVIATGSNHVGRNALTIDAQALKCSLRANRIGSGGLHKLDLGDHRARLAGARVGRRRVHDVHSYEDRGHWLKVVGIQLDVGA